jgi:hypothetical protein
MKKSCSKCEHYETTEKWCLAGMDETITDCPHYDLIGSIRYCGVVGYDEQGFPIVKYFEGPLNVEAENP